MAKSKLGPGKKQCPKCQAVIGARTMECECGHRFTPKEKTTSAKSSGVDLEKEALRFALGAGSVDKAMKAVESYKQDDLAKFIAMCGGVEKAKAELQKISG